MLITAFIISIVALVIAVISLLGVSFPVLQRKNRNKGKGELKVCEVLARE